jgi:DNA polymerase-3 subunit delta
MPQVPVARVMQRLNDGHVDPLYLFYGDEPYLTHDYISACVDRILTSASRDFNYDVFEASSDTLPQALSIAWTLPMMAAYRVVVLYGVHQLHKDDMHLLTDYAAQPSVSTALICSSADTDLKRFPAAVQQHALAIACNRLQDEPLRAWVVNTVKQQGYTMTSTAVHEFLQEQQNDLWAIKRELEKLCTYAGDTQQIDVADVQAVCHASYLHSIFKLSDALGAGDIGQAFTLIDGLLHQGEPPLVVFSMIVRHLRLLWSMRYLLQQQRTIPSIAKTLHLPQRVCRQLATQSRHVSVERLQQLYTAALEADLAFKTTNKPAKAILEELILELCTEHLDV